MKFIPIACAILCLVSQQTLKATPITEYSVDSVAGIVSELNQAEFEKPVKEWLKIHRPKQHEKMFGEKSKEPKTDSDKESKGLFSALGALSAAVAESQTFLIDYYINSKAQEGWTVVSLTDHMILFRRDPKATDGPTNKSDAEQPPE